MGICYFFLCSPSIGANTLIFGTQAFFILVSQRMTTNPIISHILISVLSHFVTQFSQGWMNNHSIYSSLLIFINILIDWFIFHTPDNVQNQNFKTSFYKNSTTNITIWQNQRISSSQSKLEFIHNTSPLNQWSGMDIYGGRYRHYTQIIDGKTYTNLEKNMQT